MNVFLILHKCLLLFYLPTQKNTKKQKNKKLKQNQKKKTLELLEEISPWT